jgi:hypothetical protein
VNEQYVELLVAPTRPHAADTHKPEAVQAGRDEPRRLNGIVFVGSVLVTQLSWLGALAYAAVRFL